MRDPARINRILGLLGNVWRKNPDFRLGQIVENAVALGNEDQIPVAAPGRDRSTSTFYMEDDDIERGLLLLDRRI
jgi:hypothetical protein